MSEFKESEINVPYNLLEKAIERFNIEKLHLPENHDHYRLNIPYQQYGYQRRNKQGGHSQPIIDMEVSFLFKRCKDYNDFTVRIGIKEL